MHRWQAILLLVLSGCAGSDARPAASASTSSRTDAGPIRGIFLDSGASTTGSESDVDGGGDEQRTSTASQSVRSRQDGGAGPAQPAGDEDAGPSVTAVNDGSTRPRDAGAMRDAGPTDAARPMDAAQALDAAPPRDAGQDGSKQPGDPRQAVIDNLSEVAKRSPEYAQTVRALMLQLQSGGTLSAASLASVLRLIDTSFDCDGTERQACESSCEFASDNCILCISDRNCMTTLADACGVGALWCG